MKIAEKIVVLLLTICIIFTSMPTCVLAETIKSIAETESKQEAVLDEESETNPKGNTATEAGKSYAINENENVATEESQSPVIGEGEEDAINGGKKSATDKSEETQKNEGENSITDNNENNDVDEGKVSGTGESEKDVTEGDKSPITDKNGNGETEESQNPVTDENGKDGTDENKNSDTDENEKDVVEKNEDSVTDKNDINKDKDSSTDEEEKSGEDDKSEEEKESEETDEDSEESESTSEITEESENNESIEETIKLNKIALKTRNTFISKLIYDENGEDWDSALHFIIRHWHSAQIIKNGEHEGSEESGLNFVVIEGYIVPKSNGEYEIYIEGEEGKEKINTERYSDNIKSVDNENGKIIFKANPTYSNDKALERFSAFSVTAGHKVTEINDEDSTISISFKSSVHLVKIHAFYINESLMVVGSGRDDAVFGTSDTQTELDQDTALVYTYIKPHGDSPAGAIVKKDGNPVYKKEDLPSDLEDGVDVKLTKVYSTLAGLHTDKTANKVEENDRKFTIDLESWFSGAKSASIGLLLDASGSMVFTSDPLKPINIYDEDVKLSNEQKEELMKKALLESEYSEADGPTEKQWEEDIFLTQEEVNQILNTHNTDNNPLSDSAYNYFVFNEADDVNEYAPLGYWDGSLNDDLYDSLIGYYEFNKGDDSIDSKRDWLINSITGNEADLVDQINCDTYDTETDVSFNIAEKPENWKTDPRIKLDTSHGLKVQNFEEGVGVLLDAQPTTNNFTISFSVLRDSSGDKGSTEAQNYTDLVYVGPLNNIKTSDHYRAVREGANAGATGGSGNSKGRLKGFQNVVEHGKAITNLNTVFNTTSTTITLVFNNGTITSYCNGDTQGVETNEGSTISLADNRIVFAGFDNDYDGALLYIDNICVFDTALSQEDVKRISNINNEEKEKEYLAYNKYGENKEKIAYVNGSFVDKVKGGMDGWYYINHDSHGEQHYFNEKYETAKALWGVTYDTNENVKYADTIKIPTGVTAEVVNTNFEYTPKKDSPTLFYLDENGYLCCFFARGTKQKQAGTSLVYKKDDLDYIKVETLQRAIGNFASKLDEASPDSEVSAVRYSLSPEGDTDYDKFVLLDWTADPAAIQKMMSLNYGTGGTREGDMSIPASHNTDKNGIYQYNYGITGGTVTYTGFKAFNDHLKSRVKEDSDKYLIVFTDGKDTSEEAQQEEIRTMAEELKNEGYTIFAVMLTGGTIEYDPTPSSEYQQAKDFLLSFVGTSDMKTEDAKNYFFSTAELGLDEKIENQEVDNIDKLTQIFIDELLERISDNLQSYSVQDYIDPRFNLVSSSGKEYKLDADGIVTIVNTDGTTYAKYDLKNSLVKQAPPEGAKSNFVEETSEEKSYLSVIVSTDIDIDAPRARLYFDNDKNMYFLKWVDQTIPGCVPNVNRLSVWNTRITVKVKDDVIGGNAVLTNGNETGMNLVYHENDSDKSSGIDDCTIDETDEYLSKGFPRVTVNIPPYKLTKESERTIYMGENLDYEDIEKNMIKQVSEELEDTDKNVRYYWEYLKRYKEDGKTADKYIEDLLKDGKIKIPYYYLPNEQKTNLTGNAERHEKDLLGELEYEIVKTEPSGGVVQDRQERQLTLTVKFIPKSIDERFNSNKDILVTDSDYKWNKTYKPDVGEVQTENIVIKNDHKIHIVSGEIALQVVFDSKVAEVIDGQKIEYDLDLYRTYQGETETVGTFKATYNGTDKMEFDDNGNFILTAKLTYLKDYMEKDGLPLGTYTIGNPRIEEAPSYIKFDEISIVEDGEKYKDELFTIGSGETTPQDFLAAFKTDTNSIILGENSPADGYLNKRFGLYAVKPIAAFEMPVAGSNALVMLYATAIACIMIATMLHISIKIRKRRK